MVVDDQRRDLVSHVGWILCRKQRKLFVALGRAELDGPAVMDTVKLRQPTYFFLRGPCSGLGEVGAPRIQPLIARQKLGPVAGEAFEEVLARPGAQVEE